MAGGAVSWFDDETVRAGSAGAAATAIAPFAVTALGTGVAESVTFSVRLAAAPESSVVGVPVIAPVAGFRLSPGGSEPPLIEKV